MISTISAQKENGIKTPSLESDLNQLVLYTSRKITQSDLKELCFIRSLNNLKVNNQITNLTKGKYKRSVKK